MVEDDIYKNKKLYENFLTKLDRITEKPKKNSKTKYFCKNPENVKYFRKVVKILEIRDLSYIRRRRMMQILKMITFLTGKDLKDCDRDDVDEIMGYSNSVNRTIDSKINFIRDIKCIWRMLFPEKDEKGRIDETLMPYPVRHLSKRIDKSRQKLRNDRLTLEEFEKIVRFFSNDKRLQAYITLAMESLGRPQEILYTRIKDYEFYDSFAKIWISEHGKEGTGFLQCIDSYPYIIEWYKQHPFKDDPNAFFFINIGNRGQYKQLKNNFINKKLKHACKILKIDKSVTCYSLKRNGVTFARLRGDSDLDIQHRARWTSTKQLKVYDMSTHEDAFKNQLRKRGLIEETEKELISSKGKSCTFCSYLNGFTADFCVNCNRPLDRKKIEEMAKTHEMTLNNEMVQRFNKMEKMFESMLGRLK